MRHFLCVTFLLIGIGLVNGLQAEEPAFVELKHPKSVGYAVFSPDGEKLATGCDDEIVRIWDTESGKELYKLEVPQEKPPGVTMPPRVVFSPDGKKLLTTTGYVTFKIWDVESGKELRRFEGHGERTDWKIFSSDGTKLLTASHDKTARLWDVETGKELRRFEGHASELYGAVFSPNEQFIATAGGDGARIWDAESGKELHKLEEPEPDDARLNGMDRVINKIVFDLMFKRVTSVAFSPDGEKLVTASPSESDTLVRIWSVKTGKELLQMKKPEQVQVLLQEKRLLVRGDASNFAIVYYLTVRFSPDGKKIVVSYLRPNFTQIWDAESGAKLHEWEGEFTAFSPDGKKVLARYYKYPGDFFVRICDVESGKELHRLEHGNIIYHALFSPDGQTVVTTSGDRTARIWDWERAPVAPPPVRPAIRDF
jgi:WD40 repeat protein